MKPRVSMKPVDRETARFGRHIATLREQLSMTQDELCNRTKSTKHPISRSYISRIEAGMVQMPSKGKLEALARALNTTVGDLLVHAGYSMPGVDRTDDEFGLTLNRLRDMNLTRGEKEDILLAIEVALSRVGKRKAEIAASKQAVDQTEGQLKEATR